MEAFAYYLFKSVIWLSGFALVFILFLRNERFFNLNRLFLITGILAAFFLPFISIHYTVMLPVIGNIQPREAVMSEIHSSGNFASYTRVLLMVLYICGSLYVIRLILKQAKSIVKSIKKSEIIPFSPARIVKSNDYTSAFSFFSYVFVNPSITDVETKEIMIHELVHIRQKHWADLFLVELLCIMQWFNPLVWIYVRFIRQNHEYLADEAALQQTTDPAIYKAVLLNQIVGVPVVSLTNSFNYSPNKKRFNMMKNITTSPFRKMKVLLILPVFAIVLYAFAKPEYKYVPGSGDSGRPSLVQKPVKGNVMQRNGKPLEGAIIVVQGTTSGTISDKNGNFKLNEVPQEATLVVSYAGFKTVVLKPDFVSDMNIKMVRDTAGLSGQDLEVAPPPPPPPPLNAIKEPDTIPAPPPPPPLPQFMNFEPGTEPLFVIDGIITSQAEVRKLDTETISSITVLKISGSDKAALKKYGEKGKNGVIEITTKSKDKPWETAADSKTPQPDSMYEVRTDSGIVQLKPKGNITTQPPFKVEIDKNNVVEARKEIPVQKEVNVKAVK